MPSPLDLHRSAWLLIERHGPDAAIHAAMRADELLDAGDLDGAAVWRAIVRAIGDAALWRDADHPLRLDLR